MGTKFRKLCRKIFGRKTVPIRKFVKHPHFTPNEDITAYELALCLQKHVMLFRDEDHINKWWEELSDNVKKHYTLVEEYCIIGWDY